MEKFIKITATAAPFPMVNVDTDMILPKQYLRVITRTGLGKHAFEEIRYDKNGLPLPDFVLNKTMYKDAKILVTGNNFGSGSSREHAPWALLDFGIRCIIAPSFADIFFNNCFKNGILPIVLKKEIHTKLMKWLEKNPGQSISVDLEKQTVVWANQSCIFNVDAFRKKCLLEGLDDIGLTLEKSTFIKSYEDKSRKEKSWL